MPMVDSIWSSIYHVIYEANSIIEGVENALLSETLRRQLKGEALFVRSVGHFYLTNLYGDVPLILTTDVVQNRTLGRTPQQDVYNRIVTDLREAVDLLVPDYRYASGGTRTRANKWTAAAMLARVYLYLGDYANAITHATSVINQQGLYGMPALPEVFQATSREAILQFYTNVYNYTYIQDELSPATDDPSASPAYVMRDELLNAFEATDARKAAWTSTITYNNKTYTYPRKYKRNSYTTSAPPEYDVFMRLGEQYLIRAEAYAHQDQIEEAHKDLEAVRTRAGLGRPVANDKSSMLLAIEHERQVELFAEYGHRWFDLKRTGRTEAVIKAAKPATWKSHAVLFPIPQAARNTNSKLGQNTGYNQ